MVYDWVPAIIIGIVLIWVSTRLGNSDLERLARLALIIIGIVLLAWGIWTGWAEITAGLFIIPIL